jgi:hypothetical protein
VTGRVLSIDHYRVAPREFEERLSIMGLAESARAAAHLFAGTTLAEVASRSRAARVARARDTCARLVVSNAVLRHGTSVRDAVGSAAHLFGVPRRTLVRMVQRGMSALSLPTVDVVACADCGRALAMVAGGAWREVRGEETCASGCSVVRRVPYSAGVR